MAVLLVTGGAGFIGSCYVQEVIAKGHTVLILDALTYSGSLWNLTGVEKSSNYHFIHGNIGNKELVAYLLVTYGVDAVINFAAESHVDKSIHNPEIFIETNVLGTQSLLDASLAYYRTCSKEKQSKFRFIHISTDEVFGSLCATDTPFTETTAYDPSSPYSASKASSDHIVRSYVRTYGMPAIITNCSNNYGPRQYPEKLIPLILCNALESKPLPIYGEGNNIRDWLYVQDHCRAIELVRERGICGETYCIGGNSERTTLEVVHTVCALLDEMCPKKTPYADAITFVKDRAGHDFRYAIDATKIRKELGWKPEENFTSGMRKTIQWYLDNAEWVAHIRSSTAYTAWMQTTKG